jgi:transposase
VHSHEKGSTRARHDLQKHRDGAPVTKKDAAARIGVHIATIDRAIRNKRLTPWKADNGYHVRLLPNEVDELAVWCPQV